MFLILILALIGVLAVCLVLIDSLWSVLELVSSYLMPYFLPAEDEPLTKKFGTWAAVTGCTDGIGKQYSLELARRGLNIVLISRNQDKLRSTAFEIEKEHKVKTKIIVADFSKGPEVYSHIEEELKDVPLGILVNNVGINYDYPMPVCEVSLPKAWELININVGAVTSMTRYLCESLESELGDSLYYSTSILKELDLTFTLALPGMVTRGRGAVVNISSGSELQPLALMTIYAASKSYVRSFTLGLREEYASKGIHVQHVAPLFISTKINQFSQRLIDGNLLVPDATTYAKHAVNTLGRVHNTSGYWIHGIQTFFIKISPEWIRMKIGANLNREFRAEYLQNEKIKAQ